MMTIVVLHQAVDEFDDVIVDYVNLQAATSLPL
jgi:hypothetical protein